MTSDYTPQQLFVPKVLWAAFLMSQLIFAGIGWFLSLQQPRTWEGEPFVLYIFGGIGVALPLAAPVVARMLAHQAPAEARGLQAIFSALIVGFAMRESGALFAFVILFLSGEAVIWAAPAGVAFASMLVAFPSPAALDRLGGVDHTRRPLV